MSTKIRNLSIEKTLADDGDYFLGDDPNNGATYKISKKNLFTGITASGGGGGLLSPNSVFIANYQTDFSDLKGHSFTTFGSPVISADKTPYSGGSSLYLPGSSYLQYTASPDFKLNADWAIELFIWIPSTYSMNNTDLPILSIDSPFNIFFQLTRSGYNNNGVFNQTAILGIGQNITVVCNSRAATNFNTWNHLAAVKVGSCLYYFLNGIHQSTSTFPSQPNIVNSPSLFIGNISGYALPTGVYIAGVRVQSASFKIPTLPFAE